MWLWDFVHNLTPFHLYEFFAVVLAVIMAVVAAVHSLKNRKKEDEK